nr:radical SAM (seleno)protein TrsS [Desulforadius tongensis]
MCPECLKKIPAVRVARGDRVYLEKSCPEHGFFQTLIWRGKPDFQSWTRPKIPTAPKVCFTEVERGCPFDCGLCARHRQHTCTALLEVTQRCNLKCTFCFADSGTGMSSDPDLEVIRGWYQRLLDAGGPYNIQLSGGEPTVRGDLPRIVALGREMGFNFIQLNTNGLRLAEDPGYVQELKKAGLNSVFLQFDGTEEAIYRKLRGSDLLSQKIAAIENCAAQNIGIVLVPTLVPGVNTHNIGEIIKFALKYLPAVRGVHFQPVSYFGRYPKPPTDEQRITIPEVITQIVKQTAGMIKEEHFRPPGCENALCSFHGNFVLMPGGKLKCWTKHQPGCCGSVELAEEGSQKARSFVSKYWGFPQVEVNTKCAGLDGWDIFLQRVRTHSFTISGMAFQDVWNLDLERVRDCCIHVVNPEGNIIPFCAYNLTDREGRSLYRSGRRRNGNHTTGSMDTKENRVQPADQGNH